MIYVTGTASSGSSCVAGVLHHLGVNMGPFLDRDGVRGYTTYECTMVNRYKYRVPGPEARGIRLRLRLREYITARMADPDGPHGFKGSALWWLDEPEPENLPVRVVTVERPIEDSIRSDWRIQERFGPFGLAGRLDRAAEIGACWGAMQSLAEIIEPAARIRYYDALIDPASAVTALVSGLMLEPTQAQLEAAIQSIDARKRHV